MYPHLEHFCEVNLGSTYIAVFPKSSAKIFRDLLRSLAQDGMTVVFSTHILEIAENVCNEIAIMKTGKIVAEGRTEELLKERNLEDVFIGLTSTEDISSVVNALRGTLR